MTSPSQCGSDFDRALNETGFSCVFRTWTQGTATYSGADYDEPYYPVAQASAFSGAAVLFPIRGDERQFRKYGVLSDADARLFVTGSLSIDGTTTVSFPNGSVYGLLPDGFKRWDISGTPIYAELFVRIINLGSPQGRY